MWMVLVWQITDNSPNTPNFPAIRYSTKDHIAMHAIQFCICALATGQHVSGFLKLFLCEHLYVCVCLCVCVSAPEAINN